MVKWKTWSGLVLLALLVSACSAPKTTPAATSAPAEPTAVSVAPTTAPAEPATPTVAVVPTEAAVVDQCISCHTDKEMLISTAKVEEEEVKESEGAG